MSKDDKIKRTIAYRKLYQQLASTYCSLEFFIQDPIRLPMYYSLRVVGSMTGWTKKRREEFVSSPLYRDFPMMDYSQRNVEIAAIVAMWINYGYEKKRYEKCLEVRNLFGESPEQYVMNQSYRYERKFPYDTFYDRYLWQDFCLLIDRLRSIYVRYTDMETMILLRMEQYGLEPWQVIQREFTDIPGFSDTTDFRIRVHTFMRWMCVSYRVDLGVWKKLPLDSLKVAITNRQARKLSLFQSIYPIRKESFDKLTELGKEFFPDLPVFFTYTLLGVYLAKKNGKFNTIRVKTRGVIEESSIPAKRAARKYDGIDRYNIDLNILQDGIQGFRGQADID